MSGIRRDVSLACQCQWHRVNGFSDSRSDAPVPSIAWVHFAASEIQRRAIDVLDPSRVAVAEHRARARPRGGARRRVVVGGYTLVAEPTEVRGAHALARDPWAQRDAVEHGLVATNAGLERAPRATDALQVHGFEFAECVAAAGRSTTDTSARLARQPKRCTVWPLADEGAGTPATVNRELLLDLRERGIVPVFNSLVVHPQASVDGISAELDALETLEGVHYDAFAMAIYPGTLAHHRLAERRSPGTNSPAWPRTR